ncbi:maleylacetoacetate isomerase [Vibrio makurazakiensis]|uniref:maleylacetoacetate isomerase n=1 Tax=Vibrio makurazakiensis TaxID=2910250 RepID=UPI003D12E6BD
MKDKLGEFRLYEYWRSSAAYRLRIALNLKQIKYTSHPVHLVKNGGEQHTDEYHALNPSELVPTLVHDGFVLSQSLAILDYLESLVSSPSLYPKGKMEFVARSIAHDIAVDIHPINNLRVLQYLKGELQCVDEQTQAWYRDWIQKGFQCVEERLASLGCTEVSGFSLGNEPSIIDICLVPQIYNAHRFHVDMTEFPIIQSIWLHANTHQAFIAALPENQDDAT